MQQQGIWKPNQAQKEIVGKGNLVKERSSISIQDVAIEIEGNVSKSTPRILERGEHSGRDMETNNFQKVMETNNSQNVMETNNAQNLLIRDVPHLNDFPNKELPVAEDGEALIDNHMNFLEPIANMVPKEGIYQLKEQCISSTFLVDHHYTCREGGEVSLDDEMGLTCSKEGFYSDNDINLYVDLDLNDSESDMAADEICEEVKVPFQLVMITRSRSRQLSFPKPLND